MQTITRKTTFDSGHRVMNEKMKCFNIHGHTYICHLTFGFKNMQEIGYAIDFKEIKRVGCQWIDDVLDHGFIANPFDMAMKVACSITGSKYWFMSLNGPKEHLSELPQYDYCNPTVENIAKEIFLAMEILFKDHDLWIYEVELFETPNCSTKCWQESISKLERNNFYNARFGEISRYANDKGIINYDDRSDE